MGEKKTAVKREKGKGKAKDRKRIIFKREYSRDFDECWPGLNSQIKPMAPSDTEIHKGW